jgi:hypothetical protein
MGDCHGPNQNLHRAPVHTFFTGIHRSGMLNVSNLTMAFSENLSAKAGAASRPEVDLSLLEDSLRLTPWQRLLENERALALVQMLEAAQPPADGTPEPNP